MSVNKSGRTIQATRKVTAKTILLRWETMLVFLFLAVNAMNIAISPNYLNAYNLFTNVNSFLVKGMVALPMAYILLLGEIDLSVGSTVCLAATILGIVYNATGSAVLGILAALAVGLACGVINGVILTQFPELAPMIVTLATMTLFRGISMKILGDTSTSGMRDVAWFGQLYEARLGVVPYLFLLFCLLAVVFGLVMHRTVYGRHMFAVGTNRLAAEYAAVNVHRVRMIAYSVTGLMCGLAAVFYCSWMGSVKSNVAEGYELEAISMCVLGGVSTAGGKGTFPGVIIAIFIVGLLRYGLGLINVNIQTIRIIIGAMLILAVMLPNLGLERLFRKRAKKQDAPIEPSM